MDLLKIKRIKNSFGDVDFTSGKASKIIMYIIISFFCFLTLYTYVYLISSKMSMFEKYLIFEVYNYSVFEKKLILEKLAF